MPSDRCETKCYGYLRGRRYFLQALEWAALVEGKVSALVRKDR